jgi:hypothetical protein
MDKKDFVLKKNNASNTSDSINKKEIKSRFDTMEQLNDWVLDLPEIEREKKETTKEISDTLQYFVNQRNKEAT